MSRRLTTLCLALIALAVGVQAQAACTAGSPNANSAESTPNSAFTVNAAAGTVTHSLTGLTWKQCSQGLSGASCATGVATTLSWSAALAAAAADTTDGGGWRLPNQKELQSIVETCGSSPAINQTVFPDAIASVYWTASTYVNFPVDAWLVDFVVGHTHRNTKPLGYRVRLVRGGQSYDTFDAQLDTIPNALSFTELTNVALSSVNTSNTITVAGINTASPVSITGGTYSINGGAYTVTAGTVSNGDTVTVKLTASNQSDIPTFAVLNIGGINGVFKVTTLTTSAGSQTMSLLPVTIAGATSLPSIVNLNAGIGPNFAGWAASMLTNALGTQVQFIEQNAQGTATFRGYQGGNLSVIPVSFQTGDTRSNGVYTFGNGQYQVVFNGQSLVMAPALVHLDQLLALLPGAVASQADNGVIVANYNGVIYAVQPGALVRTAIPSGSALLLFGNDGLHHFIDAQGNAQVLYPAFVDAATLRSVVQGLFPGATLSFPLDGTALLGINGQSFTLVPDITLVGVPTDRVGQSFWQESATRYRLVNVQASSATGTSQALTVRP